MVDRRKREARELAAATGMSYTRAARQLAQSPEIDAVLLAPYPDEQDVVREELGWRVLPADAGPAERARAEATWRPVNPGRPCRCSGGCRHGQPCHDCVTGHDLPPYPEALNRLVHVDRHPGSLFGLIVWDDTYWCEACDEQWSITVLLPDIPWGERREGGGVLVFAGVRHPNFPGVDPNAEEHPQGDGLCRSCGGYALYGFLCDGCRAEGWTDYYGNVEEPDPDDDPDECPECGAGGRGDPYGECVC